MNEVLAWLDGIDQAAFLHVNRWLHALAREEGEVATVLRVANEMGNGWILVIFVILLVALERSLGRAVRRTAEVGLAALSSGLVSYAIKKAIERPRPQATLAEAFADGTVVRGFGEVFRGSSFPSGHTATAFSLAVVFAWWAGAIPDRWRRVTVRVAVFAVVTLTGLARIYGGAHYPLDVAGGAAIGMACGWMVTRLSRWLLGPYRAAARSRPPAPPTDAEAEAQADGETEAAPATRPTPPGEIA